MGAALLNSIYITAASLVLTLLLAVPAVVRAGPLDGDGRGR